MAGTGIYGELLKAQLENLSSDPGSTSVGRVYWNTTTQSPRVYTSSGWDDLGSAGSSSGRNYLSDWFDSYKVESVGTSAATSTGNRTVAGNTDPTKWVTSDLTNLTFARSADTTLRQSYNYLINSGDANADFVESPLFTLDGVDLGKPITVSFDCAGVSASDDYQVCAVRYDSSGTYQEVIVIAGTASATTPFSARIPTGTTKFQGFFIAGSTATDQYAIRFMKHAVNVDLRIDSLYVGPEKVIQGAAITDPIAFTPESNLSTNVLLSGFYYRDGAYMVGEMSCEFTGANTQNVSMYLKIPTSIGTVDMTKTAYSQDGNSGNVCLGLFNDDSGSAYQVTGHWSGNELYCYVSNVASTYAYNTVINPSSGIPVTIADDDFISIKFRVPIVGWSSNITMADRAVEEYASNSSVTNTTDTTSFAYGMAGSPVPSSNPAAVITKRVRFNTPRQPGDILITEVAPNGNDWVVLSGIVIGAGAVGMCPFAYAEHDSSVTGLGAPVWVNSTDVDISIGTRGYYSNAAARENWASLNSAGFRWRVRKVSGGAAVGYPISPANITKSIARYTTNAAQSIDNAGSGEVIDFEDKVFDTKNNVTTGASWKFTASEAGYYRVSATVLLNNGGGWAATEAASISIRRSGTIYSRADAYQTATHSTYVTCHVDDVVYLENGQYVDILIYQNSGGAITLFNSNDYNYVSIEQVM